MQAIPPLLPTLVSEFALSYAAASSLLWLAAIPGVLLSILGGVLTGRFGVRRFAVVETAIMTGGFIVMFCL